MFQLPLEVPPMARFARTLVLLMAAFMASLTLAQPVVVMQSADAATLDPTMNRETPTFNVLINVFDALLQKEADGSYGPALATSVSYTHLRAHETDSYLVC